MRKTMAICVCFLLVCSVLGSAAVSAQPNKPLRCDVSKMWVGTGVDPVFGDHWEGTVSGDIEGTITVTIVKDRFTGEFPNYKTEHYYDTWEIVTADGKIWGYYKGVYNFNTQVERVNGRITGADPDWSHLVGDKIQLKFSVTYLKGPPILHEGMISVGSILILPSTGSI